MIVLSSCEYESEISLSQVRPLLICSRDGYPIKSIAFSIKQDGIYNKAFEYDFRNTMTCTNIDSLFENKGGALKNNKGYSVYIKTSKGSKGINFIIRNDSIIVIK